MDRMSGELHDSHFPKDTRQYDQKTLDGGHIMLAALCLMSLFYLTVFPFQMFRPTGHALETYNETGLPSRIPFIFNTWREYENVQ